MCVFKWKTFTSSDYCKYLLLFNLQKMSFDKSENLQWLLSMMKGRTIIENVMWQNSFSLSMCVWIYDVCVYIHVLCTYYKYVFVHTHIHTYILRIKKGCLNKIVQEVQFVSSKLSQGFKIFKYLNTPLLHCAWRNIRQMER